MKTEAFFRPVPSKRERAQRQLLEAALEVFGEKGPEGATVRDIANAAGQNVASIAYYYGSKDKLYRAALEGIVREIHHNLANVLEGFVEYRNNPRRSPEEALRLLQQFFSTVYLRLLSRTAMVALGRIIVREQMQPTAAFEILYEQGFRELHEMLCFLVGTCLGQDPTAEQTIIRTHALMGQMYFFAMSRETILRRLNWKDLEGDHALQVSEVLKENLEVMLQGLPRQRKGIRVGPKAGHK